MKNLLVRRRRSLAIAGSCMLVLVSCGPNDTSTASPEVATAGATLVSEFFADDQLRLAAGCTDCKIAYKSQLQLPYSGIAALSAKLLDVDVDGRERPVVVTLLSDNRRVEEKVLLAAEAYARKSGLGKLTPELRTLIAGRAATDNVAVWIWGNVALDYPSRESVIANAASMSARKAEVDDALGRVAAPIRAALAARGAKIRVDGSGSPLIRAELAVKDISAIEGLAEVAVIGNEPEQESLSCGSTHTCTTWLGTMRAHDAHAVSTGTGERICVKEGAQPDSYARLSVVEIASPTGYGDSHARGSAGVIKNTDTLGAPFNSVAPSSSLYIANWANFAAAGGVDKWCRDRDVRYITRSQGGSYAYGGQYGDDMSDDWMAKNPPFVLSVRAAGNSSTCPLCYTMGRAYNGLVVGGMNDHETTNPADDTALDGYTSWGNPATPHNDYELPNVVAPAWGASVTENLTHNASSSTAPMVAGVAAIAAARDPSRFNNWPEMKRAVVMATATQRMELGPITNLPFPSAGYFGLAGVGSVDAMHAALLGDPARWIGPNTTSASMGRYGKTLPLAAGWSASRWKATIPGTGNHRLRAVIAWDATPAGCDSLGQNCTSSSLDADIDLYLYKTNRGDFERPTIASSCGSVSFDSSYEFCDVPVIGGETYLIAPYIISSTRADTYVGIAWYTY